PLRGVAGGRREGEEGRRPRQRNHDGEEVSEEELEAGGHRGTFLWGYYTLLGVFGCSGADRSLPLLILILILPNARLTHRNRIEIRIRTGMETVLNASPLVELSPEGIVQATRIIRTRGHAGRRGPGAARRPA